MSTDSVDTSAQNRSVDYDYDSWGHFVTKETVGTVALYTSSTWDYVNAQPASVTGSDGLTVSYTYDSFGRLESETRPGTDTDYDYVACGSCFPGDAVYYVHADHTDGSDDYEFFDALNRSVGTAWTLAGGAQGRKETEYNALGQVDRVSQPYVSGETKYWVTYEYDLIGRVTEEDAPVSESITSGAITAYTYNGHEVWVTDAENNITKTLHNGAGQIEKVTDAASNYATYTYWPFGELKSMTDAESNTTTIDYDARGFKTDMSDPNMGDWEYVYNIYGELVSQTNALSDTTTMFYDEAGRLEERDEDEGTTNWYYYAYNDSIGERGKVETISAPGYYEAYEYSSSYGLPTMVLRSFDSENYVFDMTYDSHARLNVLTYPLTTAGYRFKVDYDYDAYGHLDLVKDGNEAYTYYTLNTTDALGRERTVSLGNGRNETRDYDEGAGYLKSIATTGAVQDLEFTYDEVGNVLTRFDDLIDETETFTYDSLNRLTTSQVSGESSVTIGYSAAGRITTKTGVGSYTYGAGSAGPMAVTSANGLSYTYDANGRMKTYGSDDITWYTYDKPKKIESGAETAEFWYGADRSRYMQVKASSGTPYATIHYASMLFEFEDAATDIYRHYVQAGDRVVAMVERVGTTNTRQFLHRDNQGSVTKVTNSGGTVDQALAFDAWGLRRDATDWSALGSPFAGSHETERGYTGHEHLDNVGLIHMNGRVQDPVLGRFMSADPIIQEPYSTQSHNRYSYVWNNPTTMSDPSGFCSIDMSSGTPQFGDDCSPADFEQAIGSVEDALHSLRNAWAANGNQYLAAQMRWGLMTERLDLYTLNAEFNLSRSGVPNAGSGASGSPSYPAEDVTAARLVNLTRQGTSEDSVGGYAREATYEEGGVRAALWTNGDSGVIAIAGLNGPVDAIHLLGYLYGSGSPQLQGTATWAVGQIQSGGFADMTVAGHSMGGSLAMGISSVTGTRAVTFQSIGITRRAIASVEGNASMINATNYRTRQDIAGIANFLAPARMYGDTTIIGNGWHPMSGVCNLMGC